MLRMTSRVLFGAALMMMVSTALAEAQTGTGTMVVEAQKAYAQAQSAYVQAPPPWIQEDPGSRAYQAARGYLNEGEYQQAARAFAELRESYPQSGYVADSFYYQAFALSRVGSRSEYQRARDLLQLQLNEHAAASTAGDARELLVRVESQLARQGDPQAARNITRQAQEACGPEDELRAAALNALLTMNPERALPILRRVLEDRDACSAELRSQAVFLISQTLNDESVDLLLDLAHRNPDPDPEVREQAVFWLSQVRTEEAVDALKAILQESDDPELQENALFALSQHESQRGAAVLKEFAERSDAPAELRETALFWIGQNPGGTEYLMGLWDSLDDPELKEDLLHSIAQGGDEETRAWLVERAMDTGEDMEVREGALFWAGEAGAFTLPQLRELFQGFEDPELKEQVVFVASQREETEAVDFLMEVAENPANGELREQAIFWLGQSDDPRVPEFLLRIIGGTPLSRTSF